MQKPKTICLLDCHYRGEPRPSNQHADAEVSIGRQWNARLQSLLAGHGIGAVRISTDELRPDSLRASMLAKRDMVLGLPEPPSMIIESHANAIQVASAHGLVVEGWRDLPESVRLSSMIAEAWREATRYRISTVLFPGAVGWLQSRLFHLFAEQRLPFVLIEIGNLYNDNIRIDLQNEGEFFSKLLEATVSAIVSWNEGESK